MAKRVFGFGTRSVAEALDRFARRNLTQQLPDGIVDQLDPIKPSTRIWMATAKTEITAATGGDVDVDGYEVGSGEVYLLYRWQNADDLTEFRLKPFLENDNKLWRTVYNANITSIPINSSVVFPVIQDRKGHYWVYQTATGTRGGCLAENHPGKGTVFDIYLGTWNSTTHAWDVDTDEDTVEAIDWRYGVPYPDAGATGLFEARSSATHGTIWEVVSLDCESEGPCGGA